MPKKGMQKNSMPPKEVMMPGRSKGGMGGKKKMGY